MVGLLWLVDMFRRRHMRLRAVIKVVWSKNSLKTRVQKWC